MLAPKTSVGKTVQATEPQILVTSRLRHTGSTIMTDAVLQVLAEPAQGVGPCILGGLRVEPLAGVIEEGVVGVLEHYHLVGLAGIGKGLFEFRLLISDATILFAVDA